MTNFHKAHQGSGAPEAVEAVTAVVSGLAAEIDAILARFHLSEQDAADLLSEILLLAIYRWDQIANPEVWLLATLRRACVRRLMLRQAPPEA
jgi:DNA-directed RNA polymerase specialized sigma24 family protein